MTDDYRSYAESLAASWQRLEAARTRFEELNGRRQQALGRLRESVAELRAVRAPVAAGAARARRPIPDAQALCSRFRLTRREAQVAVLLAEGRSNAAVAAALSLSPHTARHHTESILVKLGAHSRAEVGAILRRMA